MSQGLEADQPVNSFAAKDAERTDLDNTVPRSWRMHTIPSSRF